jgi:hypothetical protein
MCVIEGFTAFEPSVEAELVVCLDPCVASSGTFIVIFVVSFRQLLTWCLKCVHHQIYSQLFIH